MLPRHICVLKANKGECEALANLAPNISKKLLPLFEIGRLTDSIRERKYIKESATPYMTYLNRVIEAVGNTWSGRTAMVDGYQWPPDAQTENGEHVVAYMASKLKSMGVNVIPVVGYDRWSNAAYRLGMESIQTPDDEQYCVRLDSTAIDDAAEPDFFEETISDIIDGLGLDPSKCSVLLDFGDVSVPTMSVETMISKAGAAIGLLEQFGFHHFITAGCSIPRTINLAVESHDSVGSVLRKEALLWQALRLELPHLIILSGDYGVRGPTTTEARSKYTNGKIRHTVKNQVFIARGHPFRADKSFVQMHGLSSVVASSQHYQGSQFSWGDSQIDLCRNQQVLGSTTRWIAIDTNHHLTFVVHEVEEFELQLVTSKAIKQDA